MKRTCFWETPAGKSSAHSQPPWPGVHSVSGLISGLAVGRNIPAAGTCISTKYRAGVVGCSPSSWRRRIALSASAQSPHESRTSGTSVTQT